jgi:hypothetical protein
MYYPSISLEGLKKTKNLGITSNTEGIGTLRLSRENIHRALQLDGSGGVSIGRCMECSHYHLKHEAMGES